MASEHPEQAKAVSEMIIKNTYRTLMTRGIKGCYIYCIDSETQEYFKKIINFKKRIIPYDTSSSFDIIG